MISYPLYVHPILKCKVANMVYVNLISIAAVDYHCVWCSVCTIILTVWNVLCIQEWKGIVRIFWPLAHSTLPTNMFILDYQFVFHKGFKCLNLNVFKYPIHNSTSCMFKLIGVFHLNLNVLHQCPALKIIQA